MLGECEIFRIPLWPLNRGKYNPPPIFDFLTGFSDPKFVPWPLSDHSCDYWDLNQSDQGMGGEYEDASASHCDTIREINPFRTSTLDIISSSRNMMKEKKAEFRKSVWRNGKHDMHYDWLSFIQTNPKGRESRWVVPLKEAHSMLPLAFNGPFSVFLFPGLIFFFCELNISMRNIIVVI